MDALLGTLAKLLGTFTEPVQILLLFVIAGISTFAWKLTRFIMDRYDKDIESRAKLASALEGLAEKFEAKASGK